MFQRLVSPFSRLSHNTISMILLGLLIFLRFPFLAGIATFWEQAHTAAFFTFIIATYLLTAFLIWWERDRLRAFWIDLSSAVVFACQMVIFPCGLFPFGIGLWVAMRRSRARFPSPPPGLLRWVLIGALLAILAEIFAAQAHLTPYAPVGGSPATLAVLFGSALGQLTNAAIYEEPLFRGFLWGYLRMAGWKNVWIWLFQALLFSLAHFYYLRSEPLASFFIRMMIPALLTGLIAWRAQSITASMVTHGFINGTADLLLHYGTFEQALRVAWTGAFIVAGLLVLAAGYEIYRSRRALSPAH